MSLAIANKNQTSAGFASEKAKSVSTKTHELAPLVEIWINANPGVKTSHLLRSALRQCKELKALAGKRHAHLVEN